MILPSVLIGFCNRHLVGFATFNWNALHNFFPDSFFFGSFIFISYIIIPWFFSYFDRAVLNSLLVLPEVRILWLSGTLLNSFQLVMGKKTGIVSIIAFYSFALNNSRSFNKSNENLHQSLFVQSHFLPSYPTIRVIFKFYQILCL